MKGAFTGAHSTKLGKFELASAGTLFLDEVGDMSLSAQAKVLRALEEGVVERVGGSTPISIDVRVVAATNKNLEAEISDGNFRQDLFYRLRVVPLTIPPLRERIENIIPLCEHFLAYYSAVGKRGLTMLADEVKERFKGYEWPGNVRELRNAMERLVIMSEGDTIQLTDAESVLASGVEAPAGGPLPRGIEDLAQAMREMPDLGRFRDEAEKIFLLKSLEE